MPQAQPELKKVFSPHPLSPLAPTTVQPLLTLIATIQYLDKRLFVQLNGSRKVIGVLRGYDVRLSIIAPSSYATPSALPLLPLLPFLQYDTIPTT